MARRCRHKTGKKKGQFKKCGTGGLGKSKKGKGACQKWSKKKGNKKRRCLKRKK